MTEHSHPHDHRHPCNCQELAPPDENDIFLFQIRTPQRVLFVCTGSAFSKPLRFARGLFDYSRCPTNVVAETQLVICA